MNEENPLAWEKHRKGALERGRQLPSHYVNGQELLAETQNFFCVAGLGAFEKGCVLVLPKEPFGSFAEVPAELQDEAEWFVDAMSDAVKATYGSETLEFEHGACGCLDHGHAHYHIMALPSGTAPQDVVAGVDNTLRDRCAGIDSVELHGEALTHPSDIRDILYAQGGARAIMSPFMARRRI